MKTVEELVAFSATVEGQGIEDHSNCTCNKAELRLLANRLVELRPRSRIVEIGVFSGRSASLYFQLQADLDLDLHLVDNWSWNNTYATQMFDKLVIEHFNEVPFTFHKMRSDYLAERGWHLPIDFLYIDGWHDTPGIEPDCILWLPWVASGGIAAFHDSDYKCVQDCLLKYVAPTWTLIEEAQRMTTWRKPSGPV